MTAMDLLCSEAVDMVVQLATQSKAFEFVVGTQPEAPVQHRQVIVGVWEALAAKLNGGQGRRRVNQFKLCFRQRSLERAWKGASARTQCVNHEARSI